MSAESATMSAGFTTARIGMSAAEATAIDVPVGCESAISESAAIKVAPIGKTLGGIAVIGVPAIGKARVGISTINVATTIGISAAISISATVICALEATYIKAATDEEPGIPTFKERPIVRIVVIIPVVTVPDGIVIVGISGERICEEYSIGRVLIGIGIGALVRRIGLLIGWSRLLICWRLRLVARSRGLIGWGRRLIARSSLRGFRILRFAAGGDQHAGGCQGGECKNLFHFVCDFKLAEELSLFRYIRRPARPYIY